MTMTNMLEGKKLLVTGILNDDSIAFGVAKLAQEQGAEIVLTSFGRAMSLTRRTARKLSPEPDVLELDVTLPAHLEALTAELASRWGRRGDHHPRLDLLFEGAGRRRAAAYGRCRRVDRGSRLRRQPGVAGV